MRNSIKTSSGYIYFRTGTEGPRHDPYSYTEITVSRKGHRRAMLHMGLGVWSEVGGRRCRRYNEARDVARFEKACGWTLAELEKARGLHYRHRDLEAEELAYASECAAGWDASP